MLILRFALYARQCDERGLLISASLAPAQVASASNFRINIWR